jgi:23S rRNA (guanosine2251-2'-O)-methyltransferase
MQKKTTSELVAEKPKVEVFKQKKRHPIYIMLHNVRSLQNVGICFRLCDAMLAEKLYITGYTGYPMVEGNVPGIDQPDARENRVKYHAQREIEKTAIVTIPHVPWEYQPDPLKVIKELKQQGVQIIAVEQTHQSVDYTKATYDFPVCLIFGHEREGVGDDVLKEVDLAVELPMHGMGNSLNVATSCAIVGYFLLQKLNS